MGKADLKRSHSNDDDAAETKRTRTAGAGDVSSSKAARKPKAAAGPMVKQQDKEGDFFWGLSNTRRVTISHFKGNVLLNIREYFESGGEMRPGKKGISLSLDQYKRLAQAIPQINAQLREDGIAISDDEDGEEEAGKASSSKDTEASKKAKKAKKPAKSNIDATSDEDSD